MNVKSIDDHEEDPNEKGKNDELGRNNTLFGNLLLFFFYFNVLCLSKDFIRMYNKPDKY